MNALRIVVELQKIDPNVNLSSLAAQIAEAIRNVRGSEVKVDLIDSTSSVQRNAFYGDLNL